MIYSSKPPFGLKRAVYRPFFCNSNCLHSSPKFSNECFFYGITLVSQLRKNADAISKRIYPFHILEVINPYEEFLAESGLRTQIFHYAFLTDIDEYSQFSVTII